MQRIKQFMNSMKLVIPLHSLHWSIHTKDESKRGIKCAIIFGVNLLWRCGVTTSFGVFFHEIKCNRMTSFVEFTRNCQLVGNFFAASSWRLNSRKSKIYVCKFSNLSCVQFMIHFIYYAIITHPLKRSSTECLLG